MELRITKSRRLLQYSDLSVMEVAVACGFVSVSHFSKCYAAYFGYPRRVSSDWGIDGCCHRLFFQTSV